MPTILLPEVYDRWLHVGIDDVQNFQDRCFPDALIERPLLSDPWILRKGAPESSEAGLV
jgi:hypothetical protein